MTDAEIIKSLQDQLNEANAHISDLLTNDLVPITAEAAIETLRELVNGSGAYLKIVDGPLPCEIVYESFNWHLRLHAHQVTEAFDAIQTLHGMS